MLMYKIVYNVMNFIIKLQIVNQTFARLEACRDPRFHWRLRNAPVNATPCGPLFGKIEMFAWILFMVGGFTNYFSLCCTSLYFSSLECELADFVTGTSTEKIPFVYLPLSGQLVYPR